MVYRQHLYNAFYPTWRSMRFYAASSLPHWLIHHKHSHTDEGAALLPQDSAQSSGLAHWCRLTPGLPPVRSTSPMCQISKEHRKKKLWPVCQGEKYSAADRVVQTQIGDLIWDGIECRAVINKEHFHAVRIVGTPDFFPENIIYSISHTKILHYHVLFFWNKTKRKKKKKTLHNNTQMGCTKWSIMKVLGSSS